MDIKQLEAFACVMETSSFSQAAARLGLRQPTVSAHVAALEQELQVRLIVRTTKELRPTDAGRTLYEYAKQIIALRDDAVERMRDLSGKLRGTVTVAASTIPGKYLLPRLLREFREKYPDITFQIHLTDSGGAVRQVLDRSVEVGFCGTMVGNVRCLYRELGEDQLVVAAPNVPRYRRYVRSGLPLRQLEREKLVSREEGSGTRRETERFLKEMGVDVSKLTLAQEANSNEELQQLVIQGAGLAVLSRSAVEAECQAGQLLTLELGGLRLRRKLYIIRRRNGALSPAAQVFFQFAERTCPSWQRRP